MSHFFAFLVFNVASHQHPYVFLFSPLRPSFFPLLFENIIFAKGKKASSIRASFNSDLCTYDLSLAVISCVKFFFFYILVLYSFSSVSIFIFSRCSFSNMTLYLLQCI